MEQLELFDFPNPCKKICQTNAKGYCIGCYRNREERFSWYTFSNEQHRTILRRCLDRKIKEFRIKKQLLEKISADTSFQSSIFDLIDYDE